MSTTCPECGHASYSQEASEAQARISDLETQVRLLNNRASSYVSRLADYEEEIRNLRVQCASLQKERENNTSVAPLLSQPQPRDGERDRAVSRSGSRDAKTDQSRESLPPPPLPEKDPVVERPPLNRQSTSRLSTLTSYLPGRRRDTEETPPVPPVSAAFSPSTPYLQTPANEYPTPPSRSPSPFVNDPAPRFQQQSVTLIGLQTKLETERQLRQEAENNLTNAHAELEELTAQLFGQANEMVAQERKARAELEERVKLLETRDGEKRRRLERLEGAVARIERVRKLVVEHERELEGAREREREVEEVLQRRVSQKMMKNLRHTSMQSVQSVQSAQTRSHPRHTRRHRQYSNGMVTPEVLSEEDDEDQENKAVVKSRVGGHNRGRLARNDSMDSTGSAYYEFDVQLKVWRRSKANIWHSPFEYD